MDKIQKDARFKDYTWSIGTQYDAKERWMEPWLSELLLRMDIIFVNEQEYERLGPSTLTRGKTIVIQTRGKEGVRVHSANEERERVTTDIPTKNVSNIIDPCGAGDSFVAGFLHQYCKEKHNIDAACKWGNAIARVNIQRMGACNKPIKRAELKVITL